MMERIKQYFRTWDLSRIIRIVLGVAMGIGYLQTKESIYLIGAIIFTIQALFNLGCMGGACATNTPKTKNKVDIKIDKYETKNK